VDACDAVAKENTENAGDGSVTRGTLLDRSREGQHSAREDSDEEHDGYGGDGIVADDEY